MRKQVVREAYAFRARHYKLIGKVSENFSEDIDDYFQMCHDDWTKIAADITLVALVAEYKGLNNQGNM